MTKPKGINMSSRETGPVNQLPGSSHELFTEIPPYDHLDLDAVRIINAMYKHIHRFDTDPQNQVMERLADIPISLDAEAVPSDVQVQEYLHSVPKVIYTPDAKSTNEFSQDHWWMARRHGVARVTRTALQLPSHSGIIYCLAASRPIEFT